jgi:hypothetical protein
VDSPRKKLRRWFTRKEKGKRKVSNSDMHRNESHGSEFDSEAQGGGTSGQKSTLVEKNSTSGMRDYADQPARRNPQYGSDTTSTWRIIMRT